MTYKISGDGTTAVDPDYFWQDIQSCPRGVSVWLLTKYGKAIDGQYTGQTDIIGWCGKPKIPVWMKKLLA